MKNQYVISNIEFILYSSRMLKNCERIGQLFHERFLSTSFIYDTTI